MSARAHIPQAQISRLETASVDPQASTLIEIARTLDLELQLVPRAALAAVAAVVRSAEERAGEQALRDLLAQARRAAEDAYAIAPAREEIAAIRDAIDALEPMASGLRALNLEPELRTLLRNLEVFVKHPPAQRGRRTRALVEAAAALRSVRNRLAHSVESERPAYSLEDEDQP